MIASAVWMGWWEAPDEGLIVIMTMREEVFLEYSTCYIEFLREGRAFLKCLLNLCFNCNINISLPFFLHCLKVPLHPPTTLNPFSRIELWRLTTSNSFVQWCPGKSQDHGIVVNKRVNVDKADCVFIGNKYELLWPVFDGCSGNGNELLDRPPNYLCAEILELRRGLSKSDCCWAHYCTRAVPFTSY